MDIRIAGIVKESVVDGPGIRLVIFMQGCLHHCPGCHNQETHDVNGGYIIKTSEILAELDKNILIRGVTFSGGEPFLQADVLAVLARMIHVKGLNVVTYSGYYYEKLLEMGQTNKGVQALLQETDILVDGPFRQEERDLSIAFRGSRNQRLIDIQESLRKNKVVIWKPESV